MAVVMLSNAVVSVFEIKYSLLIADIHNHNGSVSLLMQSLLSTPNKEQVQQKLLKNTDPLWRLLYIWCKCSNKGGIMHCFYSSWLLIDFYFIVCVEKIDTFLLEYKSDVKNTIDSKI